MSTIVISHSHSDHVCELSLFLQGMYLARRKEPVTVYMPQEFVQLFKRYLTGVYLFPERFPFDFSIEGYAGTLEIDSPVRIRAIANSHLHKYQPYVAGSTGDNQMQSHSFIIETTNARLFYSADIGSHEEILPHFDGVDYLVTELSHVDREVFMRAIKERGIKRIVVTHIDGEDEAEAILEIANRVGISHLEIACDGMQLSL